MLRMRKKSGMVMTSAVFWQFWLWRDLTFPLSFILMRNSTFSQVPTFSLAQLRHFVKKGSKGSSDVAEAERANSILDGGNTCLWI